MKPLNIIQVGICHEHANGKFDTIRKCPDCFNLVGVVDERPFSNTPRCQEYTYILEQAPRILTLDEALNWKGLDAVLIEVPNLDLAPTAILFAGKSIPMHCDKPCGETMEPYRTLLDICTRKAIPFQMGYMFRGNPAVRFAIQAVKDGILGEIFEFQADMNHCYGGEAYQDYIGKFRGGIMFNLGCHLIDIAVSMLGRPAHAAPFLKPAPGDSAFNNCTAVLDYPNATAVITSCSRDAFDGRRRLRIGGTNGSLEFCPIERYDGQVLEVTMKLKEARGGYPAGPQVLSFGPQTDRYEVQLREFAAVVRGEAEDAYTRKHDLLVHEVTLAASGCIRL